jgi:hypothetical protein
MNSKWNDIFSTPLWIYYHYFYRSSSSSSSSSSSNNNNNHLDHHHVQKYLNEKIWGDEISGDKYSWIKGKFFLYSVTRHTMSTCGGGKVGL